LLAEECWPRAKELGRHTSEDTKETVADAWIDRCLVEWGSPTAKSEGDSGVLEKSRYVCVLNDLWCWRICGGNGEVGDAWIERTICQEMM
jgi:hypothetical protein